MIIKILLDTQIVIQTTDDYFLAEEEEEKDFAFLT